MGNEIIYSFEKWNSPNRKQNSHHIFDLLNYGGLQHFLNIQRENVDLFRHHCDFYSAVRFQNIFCYLLHILRC